MWKNRSRRSVVLGSAALVIAATAGAGVALAVQDSAKAPYAQAAAVVNADGSLVRAKGIESVTKPKTGRYCIKLSDPDIDVTKIVANVSAVGGGTWDSAVFVNKTAGSCDNDPHTLQVTTGKTTGGTHDQPFTVTIP